jgi:hypothetical protein
MVLEQKLPNKFDLKASVFDLRDRLSSQVSPEIFYPVEIGEIFLLDLWDY